MRKIVCVVSAILIMAMTVACSMPGVPSDIAPKDEQVQLQSQSFGGVAVFPGHRGPGGED